MDQYLQTIYIKILKYNWKISGCEDLGNGYIIISIYNPERYYQNMRYQYYIKYSGDLASIIKPRYNKVCSYLLTPGRI